MAISLIDVDGPILNERNRLLATAILAWHVCLVTLVFTMNVHRVAVLAAILVLCIAAPLTAAQTAQPEPNLPVVKSAEMPLYPELARQGLRDTDAASRPAQEPHDSAGFVPDKSKD